MKRCRHGFYACSVCEGEERDVKQAAPERSNCPHPHHLLLDGEKCPLCTRRGPEGTRESEEARLRDAKKCPHCHRSIPKEIGRCVNVFCKTNGCPHVNVVDGVCGACGARVGFDKWIESAGARAIDAKKTNGPPCPHRNAGAPACNDCRAVALEDLLHFLVGAVHEPWLASFVPEAIHKIDEGRPWRTK